MLNTLIHTKTYFSFDLHDFLKLISYLILKVELRIEWKVNPSQNKASFEVRTKSHSISLPKGRDVTFLHPDSLKE